MSDSKKQKFFELIPSGTQIAFIANRWRYITISIVLLIASFGALAYNQATKGSILNFGIDFAGGSQVRLRLDADKDPGVDAIREALEEGGYESSSVVTVPDSEHEVLVRVKETLSIDEAKVEACRAAVQTILRVDGTGTTELLSFNHPPGGSKLFFGYDAEPNYKDLENKVNDAGCQGTADKGFGAKEGESPAEFALIGVGSKIRSEFDAKFGEGAVAEIVRSETVGAKVGGQLKEDGAKSMLYAIGFIFLFVMIRFDLRFAPGGIVALTHDAILVIGAFAITGKEFNLQTIAAILTVIGYSINDTIVVFDRVRERVALHRDEPIEKVTNDALNDTLSRTILTSGTTLLVVLATFFMGAGPIKDFAFALIIGVLVGTFSSLYIATPVFLWVNKRFYGGRGHLAGIDEEGTGTLLSGGEGAEGGDAGGSERPDVVDTTAATGAEEGTRKKTRRRRRRPRPSSED
jgi:preprotein translocase subunit SecF